MLKSIEISKLRTKLRVIQSKGCKEANKLCTECKLKTVCCQMAELVLNLGPIMGELQDAECRTQAW